MTRPKYLFTVNNKFTCKAHCLYRFNAVRSHVNKRIGESMYLQGYVFCGNCELYYSSDNPYINHFHCPCCGCALRMKPANCIDIKKIRAGKKNPEFYNRREASRI